MALQTKPIFRTILIALFAISPLIGVAQGGTGIMIPHRLGLFYQQALGVDLGLISFNQWSDRGTLAYYDLSLGTEAFITKPFIVAPKISFDFGVGGLLLFAGGVDVAMPTDFKRSTFMVTPKAGVSLGSLIRLYYGRSFFEKKDGFPDIGKHRVSLEVNISTLHDMKIGF